MSVINALVQDSEKDKDSKEARPKLSRKGWKEVGLMVLGAILLNPVYGVLGNFATEAIKKRLPHEIDGAQLNSTAQIMLAKESFLAANNNPQPADFARIYAPKAALHFPDVVPDWPTEPRKLYSRFRDMLGIKSNDKDRTSPHYDHVVTNLYRPDPNIGGGTDDQLLVVSSTYTNGNFDSPTGYSYYILVKSTSDQISPWRINEAWGWISSNVAMRNKALEREILKNHWTRLDFKTNAL